MAVQKIKLPEPKRPRKAYRAPTRLTPIHTGTGKAPTLLFSRAKPKSSWLVPPIEYPMYWFDMLMVQKGWITPVPPHHFIADGKRFEVLAQQHHVIGIGYTRWLVFEVHPQLDKP